ncbi:MAG: type II secretion system F family protein [Deltaproteobacteria bacterium]|nr:type II secretion system F family protein [Deltaproteobacteria bacterium]
MALFTYQATDASGRSIKGSLEAKDELVLVDKLQEMGYFPINIGKGTDERALPASAGRMKFFSGRVSGRSVTLFTHELSSMLEAGLALDRSLSILAELEKNAVFKSVILDIHKGIHGGLPLADSLDKHPDVFSEIYVSTVRAGEAGGSLESVLSRIKRFMEETEKLKEDIKSALIYPLLLTVVGGSAIMLMLLFVIPKFTVIFADMGGVMPLPTRMLLGLSEGVSRYWWVIAGAAAVVFFTVRRRLRTEEGRLLFDRLKLEVPLLGEVLRKAVISRFSRTLGTLLQGGLPILEALNIAVKTMGNSFMSRDIQPVIEGVRRGRGMVQPLKETKSFPPLAVHLLTVGEETGKLDEMLLKLSDNYDQDISTSIKRLLSLMEPLIILVMAVVVGFIVISLLLAIFSLNDMPV